MTKDSTIKWFYVACLFLLLFAAAVGGIEWLKTILFTAIIGAVLYWLHKKGLLRYFDDYLYPLLLILGVIGLVIYGLAMYLK